MYNSNDVYYYTLNTFWCTKNFICKLSNARSEDLPFGCPCVHIPYACFSSKPFNSPLRITNFGAHKISGRVRMSARTPVCWLGLFVVFLSPFGKILGLCLILYYGWFLSRWSQWPRILGPKMSSPARSPGSWVRIPLEAWMSVCVYSVFVLSFV
jgi:hypothetical protein